MQQMMVNAKVVVCISALWWLAAVPATAQELADTTQLAALGTWPQVAEAASDTLVNSGRQTAEPAPAENFKGFVTAKAAQGTLLTSKENLKRLNSAIKANPKNAAAYTSRGKVKYELNNMSGAIKDFTIALALSPTDPEPYYWRGLAWLKAGDYLGAVEDLTKALAARPTQEGFISRGKAKAALFDYRGAVADNTKALEMDPENPDALFNRAAARFYLKDYYNAIADFSTVTALKMDWPEAYYFRGLARYRTGDKDGGCLDLSRAGELGYYIVYEEIKSLCR